MIINIKDKFINQCISKFGVDNQLDILQEECAELIKAVSKYKRFNNKSNLIEELTHVAISSEIVAKLLSITPQDIEQEIISKSIKYNFK